MDAKSKFQSIIDDPGLAGRSSPFGKQTRDSLVGRAFKKFYPEEYDKRMDYVTKKRPEITANLVDSISSGNAKGVTKNTRNLSTLFRQGPSRFNFSVNTKFMNNINTSIAKKAGSALGTVGATGLKMLGGTPLKGAAMLGVAAGVVFGTGSLMGYSPTQTASGLGQAANAFNEVMKQGAKPTYGSSQLGQSVQGLTFGLHSRRTR